MARRRDNFDEFAAASFDLYSRGVTIAPNGGMTNTPVLQGSVSGSLQNVWGQKREEWAQDQIEATHVLYLFDTTPGDHGIQVGWYFVDEYGGKYEIVWVEAQGGEGNPNFNVLAIYGRRKTAAGATA